MLRRTDGTRNSPSTDRANASEALDLSPEDRAERRQITVMFSDLVGSIALSAGLDPEDMREVITAYQDVVAETIGRFGGFVAKYIGDEAFRAGARYCPSAAGKIAGGAAMSMARLWRDQGERREAHDLLAPMYGWFTEDFDTPDLGKAKVLHADFGVTKPLAANDGFGLEAKCGRALSWSGYRGRQE